MLKFLKKISRQERAQAAAIDAVCIVMVKNEQDIIEPFLRHNEKFFDLMIVLDNGSTDETRQILNNCSRELGHVIIADLPSNDFLQADFMTRAMRMTQEAVQADVFCILDADEFISSHTKFEFLNAVRTLSVGSVGSMPWRTLIPDPTTNNGDIPDSVKNLKLERACEYPTYYKCLIRAGGKLLNHLRVGEGNHVIYKNNGKRVHSVKIQNLHLWHAPIRSSDQALTKGVNGWRAIIKRGDTSDGHCYQWARLHDTYEKGQKFLDAEQLAHEAMIYAQQFPHEQWRENAKPTAFELAYERKYSDGKFAPTNSLLNPDETPDSHKIISYKPLLNYQKSENEEPSHIENTFDNKWHWEHFFLDIPPIRFALDYFKPKSILDLGCGSGSCLHVMKYLGAEEILGIDGISLNATMLDRDEYLQLDLQEAINLQRHFDLVICLEVLEHLRPDATDILIDNIARHARDAIIFSVAEPEQPGNGHINCITMDHALDMWKSRGWLADVPFSLGLRSISTMSWLRRNFIVLRPKSYFDESHTDFNLRKISWRKHQWYGQPSGIRYAPFLCDETK